MINVIIQDIVELEEAVALAQEKFDLLDKSKREIEIKMNEIYKEYEQWKKTAEKDDLNQAEYDQANFMESDSKDRWREQKAKLELTTEKWQKAKDDLELKKLELELKETDLERLKKIELVRRYQNVGITLAKTCESLIKEGLSTNCPTYGELAKEYDNTEPQISGAFVDQGYDVRRSTPLQKHWNYYDRYPNHIIIMVDPDYDFRVKNTIVEIQSSNFTSTTLVGNQVTKYNGENITVWKNFRFTDDCKKIMVAPNPEDINKAVNFAMQNCYGDFEIDNEIITLKKHDEIPWYESPSTMFKLWLEEVKASYKGYMIGND